MAAGNQARPSGESWQNQKHGGDLLALAPREGIPDYRLFSSWFERRGHESWWNFSGGRGLDADITQIKPVQKQTRAGQRTRFKAIVAIGDSNGHVGLGIKTSKEVATAIRAAITIAKLSVLPVRRGFWGTALGNPHSLPTKESGKCGSVSVRLIPAPRGTGLVASPAVKRLMQLAGVEDAYTSSTGSTKTLENTLKATFTAIGNSYGFLTPNLWKETKLQKSPLEEYGDILREGRKAY